MKKFLVLGLALSMVNLYACGGDDSSALDPTTADFDNPTGTLSEDNAKDVANAGVDSSSSGTYTNPTGITGALSSLKANSLSKANAIEATDFEDCTTANGDGSTTTIDWECVFNVDTADECTGGGSTTVTSDSGSDFYTIVYDGFNIDCGEGDGIFCDGTINIANSTSGTGFASYCADFTCSVDDLDIDFNGCVNGDGDILVTVNGSTFVIGSLGFTDASCDEVSMTVTDAEGDHTLTCDVSGAEDSCSLEDISSVTNCSITDGASDSGSDPLEPTIDG